MALKIETFNNQSGGNTFYKALVHPISAEKINQLLSDFSAASSIAIYDPLQLLECFSELYDLSNQNIAQVYVQKIEALSRRGSKGIEDKPIQLITEIGESNAPLLFVVAFDAQRLIDPIKHLLPKAMTVVSLDQARLPDDMLTNTRRYLVPLNFATNFGFLREQDGLHTTIACCNYWQGYGAKNVKIWFFLFDQQGKQLAQWVEQLPDSMASYAINSQEIRARFDLPEFTGSLFMHVQNVSGHDVVKYAVDIYGDKSGVHGDVLSCTHDANAWPSDHFAGLPAPDNGEQVILWVQNSSPVTIPKKGIGLNLMGSNDIAWLDREIAPYESYALNVADLLPQATWPQQIEVQAGKYFVRPRYEVRSDQAPLRIAHANVERADLEQDDNYANISALVGKGYILPAPLLPLGLWKTTLLPTPMSTKQHELPLALAVYDKSGKEIIKKSLGRIARDQCTAIDIDTLLSAQQRALFEKTFGHIELSYDMSDGGYVDGWLHALIRYQHREHGHRAETSFGAHIYNIAATYKNEPQSYAGPPPGLSTRLFLRLGNQALDTQCHLIYPASKEWHAHSSTALVLYNNRGDEIAQHAVEIACSGSLLWRYHQLFDKETRAKAGDGAYIMIRDATCRLFGYHGLINEEGRFSLDHMFGF